MIMALRSKEMKLVMINESKVCGGVSRHSVLSENVAYASTCDSCISLYRIRNDRAVARRIEHCDSISQTIACKGM